jgi:hypothetical protein
MALPTKATVGTSATPNTTAALARISFLNFRRATKLMGNFAFDVNREAQHDPTSVKKFLNFNAMK